MIKISKTDFEKYGCPNCGCSQIAHSGNDYFYDYVICMECGTGYVVVSEFETREDISDELKKVIKFANSDEFNRNLESYKKAKKMQSSDDPEILKSIDSLFDTLIEYLMYLKESSEYMPHPRNGIPKHDISTNTNSIGAKK